MQKVTVKVYLGSSSSAGILGSFTIIVKSQSPE